MDINYNVINSDEKAIFKMRSLYKKYGYSQFKMSKFEEYDLYVRNKDYLVSENIITFTDTDGRLMALKPDVTLSIIKNTDLKKGGVRKVFYDENVYRVSKRINNFKEIMQVGLECIGEIDTYNIYEVIMLAAKSLQGISEDYVLDISNLDIVSDLLNSLSLDSKSIKAIIKCVGEKNIHGITAVCEENGVDESDCDKIKRLVSLYGDADSVLAEIKEIVGSASNDAVAELEKIVNLIKKSGLEDKIKIDFSVISDINYYNGFVFKGFIKGISSWVLSGGQYDNLMRKMRSDARAVGFAVYLDMLERFEDISEEFDVDAILLYDDNADIELLYDAVNNLMSEIGSVLPSKVVPSDMKYRKLYKLSGSGVNPVEINA